MTVPESPSHKGIYLGEGEQGWAWSGAQHSTLVLGPSRSGKTSALVVPNVLAAAGAVVVTSTKPDVLRMTASARAAVGWTLLFDPTGTIDAPPEVHRVGWSPVAAAGDWQGAIDVTEAMVRTARGRPHGAVGAGVEGHWSERSAALLAPLLHAAALEAAPMRRVLHWVDRHDGSQALSVLADRCGDDAVPTDALAGILSTDAREQSGIWSTTSGVLAAYRSPAALASTDAPYLDPAVFCDGRHTLFVCASAVQQQQLAPLVVGMLGQLREAAYRRALAKDVAVAPVLFALDEVANIAPLPDLPSIVTEGPGQGLLTLACLQDLSQARARWGETANSFVSLFGSSVVLGGIADMGTLETLSALGGDREVPVRSVGVSQGHTGRQVSTSDSTMMRRRITVDAIARGSDGWALCIDARNRLGWVRLTPAHAAAPWSEVVNRRGGRDVARAARGLFARSSEPYRSGFGRSR